MSDQSEQFNLGAFRRTYEGGSLDVADVNPDPFIELEAWFAGAKQQLATEFEVNAAALATVDEQGRPSLRMLLIKEISSRGVTFLTNYDSRKSQELAANPNAAICIYWPPLFRQIRITGTCERIAPEESDAYFKTRPADSRRAAWASQQSREIQSRAALDEAMNQMSARFPNDNDIPRPEGWGGFRLTPREFEFWQGRPNRLHDRVLYESSGDSWTLKRLQP